jgi:hypothetical protein
MNEIDCFVPRSDGRHASSLRGQSPKQSKLPRRWAALVMPPGNTAEFQIRQSDGTAIQLPLNAENDENTEHFIFNFQLSIKLKTFY